MVIMKFFKAVQRYAFPLTYRVGTTQYLCAEMQKDSVQSEDLLLTV